MTGVIKGIRNNHAYLQLPKTQANPKQTQIGRLHQIECQNETEFKSFAIGDRIECKVLSLSTSQDKQFIELTRNPKHMAKLQGLDEQEMAKCPTSLSELKKGKKYRAIVVSNTD